MNGRGLFYTRNRELTISCVASAGTADGGVVGKRMLQKLEVSYWEEVDLVLV